MVMVLIYSRRECASCRWFTRDLALAERLKAPPNAKLIGKCTRLNNLILENNGKGVKHCKIAGKKRRK